jgi:hypothetical protein
MWHEGCTLCYEEKAPSSETERLLAGSLAIAELAALRKKMVALHKEFDDFANEWSRHREGADEAVIDRSRARAGAWHMAAEKLKTLLGDAQ